jgi:hypothetical protein
VRARKIVEAESAKQFLRRRIGTGLTAKIVTEAETRLMERLDRFQKAGAFGSTTAPLKYSAIVAVLATVVEDMQSENSILIRNKIKKMRELLY